MFFGTKSFTKYWFTGLLGDFDAGERYWHNESEIQILSSQKIKTKLPQYGK